MNMNRIKKVIVVYGGGSSGKTTSLRMLCQSLLSGKKQTDFTLIKGDAYQDLVNPPNNVQINRPDVMLAVHHNGKLVGVGTAGDIWDSVWQNFMFFDQCYPDESFDVVFVAIREQHRQKGVGDCGRSFPLMALEELECQYGLQVQRPFVRVLKVPKKTGNFKITCQSNNQNLAQKLLAMV